MHRTEGTNYIISSGKNLFSDSIPASTINASWLNAIQEEICKVVEMAGINLQSEINESQNQLYTALDKLLFDKNFIYDVNSVIEITSSQILTKNKTYIVNGTSRLELTLPTLLTNEYIEIVNKSIYGYKIKANIKFYGYKKILFSKLINDRIRLIGLSLNNDIGINNFRQIDNLLQYGFFLSGWIGTELIGAVNDTIDYIDNTLLTGNAVDRGNVTQARSYPAGIMGIQYSFCGGGSLSNDETVDCVNTIDYIDNTLLTGNAVDRGDLLYLIFRLTGISSIQYGFFCGGYIFAVGTTNRIHYIDNTVLTGNSVDRSYMISGLERNSSVSGIQYGFTTGGGVGATEQSTIEYIDTTLLTNNAVNRGDLTVARFYSTGVSGSQYGFVAGGNIAADVKQNVIDYIDQTLLTGNAIDRGDLTVARYGVAGISGIQYGFIGGGYIAADNDTIDYIDMTLISGNAIDRGNLTVARHGLAGA